ncbi:MAG: lipid-binding protein [Bacteroidales bacterium]|nr:lipid-binding protein [Bacteroidales bacterium]HOK99878.1 lipid-binding protein [Bacteroidales bacterium]HPO66282.1 lipid-binding protein [Bacteroidales bacterium]
MKNYKYLLAFILPIVILVSCETMEEPKIEYSPVYPLSGEWFVKFEAETSPGTFEDIYHLGYVKILTYNTAYNSKDTMWIDDLGNTWSFKIKCPINVTARTFGMNDSMVNYDTNYPIKIYIREGIVLQGKGRSISGVVTDSISFLIGFEDDPGTVYRISGHRRTGFIEDEP